MAKVNTEDRKVNGCHFRQRNNIYIALEEVDLTWSLGEVMDIREMWNAGVPLTDIARKVKRQPDELALLIFDQAIQGKIQKRDGGIFGSLPGAQEKPGKGARIEEILLSNKI
jgi:hypothetical protein